MGDSTVLLKANDLHYAIGDIDIVRGLTLTLKTGQVLGLIGPNGAGKTTAIDLLSGFSIPKSGNLVMDGKNITALPADARARLGLTRTFQESPAIPGLTVREHLQLALDVTAHNRRGNPMALSQLLERFGLTSYQHCLATELATNQRRMLDMGRAIGTRPRVLLLDEPYAGLGQEEEFILNREIANLKKQGVAMIVVEHRLAQLDSIADFVIALVNGVPLITGTLVEVLTTPAVRCAFMGGSIPVENEVMQEAP